MERKLVTIRRVDEILPIDGADNIELVKIDGWQCVVKKGEFSVGDLGFYFEIDSFIPFGDRAGLFPGGNDRLFGFLIKNKINWEGKEGVRVRSIKLRKTLSQGLFIPWKDVDESLEESDMEVCYKIGEDWSEQFGVEKWERAIPAQLAGKIRGNFPGFIRKTDQERIQNIYNKVIQRDDIYEVTIKLDGSSMTVYRKDGRFGVCSRNLDLIETDDNAFWRVARSLDLENKMIDWNLDDVAIQGELMGPGVQGNRENLPELDFFVFDVFDIRTETYWDPSARIKLINNMGINHAPIYELGKRMDMSLDRLLAYAEGTSYNSSIREGLVWKSYTDPDFSWKVISNKYLLKHGD